MIGRSTANGDTAAFASPNAHICCNEAPRGRVDLRYDDSVSTPVFDAVPSGARSELMRAPLTAAGLLLQTAEHAFDGHAAVVVDHVSVLDLVAVAHRRGADPDRDAAADVLAVADRAHAFVQH